MSDPNLHITTPRLYISYLDAGNETHCDFLVALYNSPEFIAAEGKTAITTPDAARARLGGQVLDQHARLGHGIYLVSLRPTPAASASASDDADTNTDTDDNGFSKTIHSAVPIGTVSLLKAHPPTPESFGAPDLGFAFLPPYFRRGYATEAARALLAFARAELGVTGVLGLCDPGNAASRGVFRKLGFEDRGVRVLKPFGGVRGCVFWDGAGEELDEEWF